MWRYWKSKVIESIGLDVNDKAIHLVSLTQHIPSSEIEIAYSSLPLPLLTATDIEISDTIKSGMAKLNTQNKRVIMGISDINTFTQPFSLDTNKRDWRNFALLKAAPRIPLPLDTLRFDATKTIEQSQDNLVNNQVMHVACPSMKVEKQCHLAQISGLNPAIIEVNSHAIERACHYLYQLKRYPKCWVLIQLDSSTMTVFLWNSDELLSVSSDYLHFPENPDTIPTQLYQQLSQLMLLHAKEPLEALWIIGDHPHSSTIEDTCRKNLKLKDFSHLFAQPHSKIEPLLVSGHIALGLALRGINFGMK